MHRLLSAAAAARCRHALKCSPPNSLAFHAASAPHSRCSSTGPTVTARGTDHAAWYASVIAAADLTDAHTPVRGCAILKPRGYAIWELIQKELDARIRRAGHSNVYFPLLVPASLLSREAAHVGGFASECAVVTHTRLRPRADGAPGFEADPLSVLSDPMVVRPTSEAIVWNALHRWVRTHRDLPLLLNQWANVVRWEMRTRPFLRTSEFLWQEGHTAHADEAEAVAHAAAMQTMYAEFMETVLALPSVLGAKSSSERFAGAADTLTCESMMQNGWALQAATSHYLGQNFARAFDVRFNGADGGPRSYVWATSWGASSRLIGGTIMSHSDDVGLVLPPAVAPTQVVIVPILRGGSGKRSGGAVASGAASGGSSSSSSSEAILAIAKQVQATLSSIGIRIAVDDDIHDSPGSRFYTWERRGVPLRLEIGARELSSGHVLARDRLGGPRLTLRNDASLPDAVQGLLRGVHSSLLASAKLRLERNTRRCTSYAEMLEAAAAAAAGAGTAGSLEASAVTPPPPLSSAASPRSGPVSSHAANSAVLSRDASSGASDVSDAVSSESAAHGDSSGFVSPMFLVPWCDDAEAEAQVKAETKFTLRCFPSATQSEAQGQACVFSGKPATHMALFARGY